MPFAVVYRGNPERIQRLFVGNLAVNPTLPPVVKRLDLLLKRRSSLH
jgi:hypothetical protein